MASIELTETRDLRDGTVPWQFADWHTPVSGPLPDGTVDVAVIGSGIMGAILAESLSAEGKRVAVLDRRPPGKGSTAASTAQIMWAMDVPMVELAATMPEDEAALRWKRVFAAVQRFAQRLDRLHVEARHNAPTLYLAGNRLDEEGLRAEAQMRASHGLPSEFLCGEDVAARFGVKTRGAILSECTYMIDPVETCHALLKAACERGTTLSWPMNVLALHPHRDGIELELDGGASIRATDVVLATGYERARLFLPPAFSLLSTFAIATPPDTAPLWKGDVMIWEASDPYLYVRTCRSGRIIAGGEDINLTEDIRRNELIPAKAGAIAAKLEALVGKSLTVDRSWAATFGASPDGLPAIGRSSLMEGVWLASGFGGNGIAFAALASELLATALTEGHEPDLAMFAPDRFE